ncbi:MAG: hypoxanthine phosphoribosyltransferase [Pseudobdellovibrionaceae bacterium]|nr:hypoxanthine phosphoribosyltransferase [Bdellovibrionales bacterium]USN46404.1 MAG: hypoxanthine phosphoribosyltransferase [Pseudobdellovibrionaceae bacterium]
MDHLKLKTLISEEQISERVRELGRQITKRFKNEPLVAVCVLNGAILFFSDLVREIDADVTCEFIGLSSYGAGTYSTGDVRITADFSHSVRNKHILIVEDIIDSGLTMSYLQQNLKSRGAKSITTATLLHKPKAQKTECEVDFVGFEIPNDFVVGYGLDYQGYYRNLPYIAQVQNIN